MLAATAPSSRIISLLCRLLPCPSQAPYAASFSSSPPRLPASADNVCQAPAAKGIGGTLVAWAAQPVASRGPLPLGTDAWVRWSFDARAVAAFAALAGDDNPVHVDAAFAARTRFTAPIVHGMLVASLWGTLLGATVPGSIYISQSVTFRAPVYVAEHITAQLAVTSLDKGGRRVICATRIIKTDGSVAADGEAVVMLPRSNRGEEVVAQLLKVAARS